MVRYVHEVPQISSFTTFIGTIFGPHSVGFQFNHFSALQCQFFGNQNLDFGQGEFQKLDLNSLHRAILFWQFFSCILGRWKG